MKTSDKISSSLEESILRGDYKDGQQLNEINLSRQFNVSRTPIREALQKLTKSGLVEQIHGRGVFVRQPGANELFELFELMAELESSCGRLAAMRISESALDELHDANAKCKVAMLAGEADNYYYANRVFHSVIYRESGNSVSNPTDAFNCKLGGVCLSRCQSMKKSSTLLDLETPRRLLNCFVGMSLFKVRSFGIYFLTLKRLGYKLADL
jgi:DNA-binding transcriptional regulator YhcF (GntR family)